MEVGYMSNIDFIYEKDKYLRLYIADEPLEKELGLMYVEKLNPDQGMIFVFNPPERVNFWMKNTLIPLDIIFIKLNILLTILINHDIKAIVAFSQSSKNDCQNKGIMTTKKSIVKKEIYLIELLNSTVLDSSESYRYMNLI